MSFDYTVFDCSPSFILDFVRVFVKLYPECLLSMRELDNAAISTEHRSHDHDI